VDKADISGLPVRYVKLEHADAQNVAGALQKFFQDRATAMGRGGQRNVNRVAVMGDRKSGTLIVSASDDDFEQVKSLVATFDSPSKAQAMQFRIVPLKNARVTDLQDTITGIADQLQWERQSGNSFFWSPWSYGGRDNNSDKAAEDKLFVQTNEKTNSVVLMGQGETLDAMVKIIDQLDQPVSDQAKLAVRTVRGGARRSAFDGDDHPTSHGDAGLAHVPRAGPRRCVSVQVDGGRRMLMLIGKQPRVEQALAYVNELKGTRAQNDSTLRRSRSSTPRPRGPRRRSGGSSPIGPRPRGSRPTRSRSSARRTATWSWSRPMPRG